MRGMLFFWSMACFRVVRAVAVVAVVDVAVVVDSVVVVVVVVEGLRAAGRLPLPPSLLPFSAPLPSLAEPETSLLLLLLLLLSVSVFVPLPMLVSTCRTPSRTSVDAGVRCGSRHRPISISAGTIG